MGLNASDKVLKSARPLRQALVARLRIRQLSQREIARALEREGNINPVSGKPWSLGIINADIKAIEKMWHEEMLRDTSIHKANVLAALHEVQRRAWGEKIPATDVILRALQQERALLGLDAPTKIAPTDPTGTKEYADLSDDERAERITAIFDAAAKSRAGRTSSVDGHADENGSREAVEKRS